MKATEVGNKSVGVAQPVRFRRLKSAIGYVIFQPWLGHLLGAWFRDRIPSRGLTIDTSNGVSGATKAQLFWGTYESAEIGFVSQFVPRNHDVVELGSSLGVVSCHIARSLDSNRQLYCVEANPNLLSAIRSNLAINSPRTMATVINAAVHCPEVDGAVVQFKIGPTNLESAIDLTRSHEKCVSVRSTTLSRLLSEHNVTRYVLVSDIEGAELGIVLHDSDALGQCQQIVIELHESQLDGRSYSIDQLINAIHSIGFTLIARRGAVCVFGRPEATLTL